MSWPFGPDECPRCVFLEPVEPPIVDDSGYEVVGFCRHPRIAMDLFLFQRRDQRSLAPCPCFRPPRQRPEAT